MVNIAICDDELNAAKSFIHLVEISFIKNNFKINIVTITDNQEEIYKLIKDHKIDLLFLDIDFKNSNIDGMTLSKKLRKVNKDFYLVFLTAYSRYMPISFLSKTFDYLTKPIHVNVINNFTKRFIEEYKETSMVRLNNKLSIKTNSILYIEKMVNKCLIYTETNSYSCIITINNLLNILPNEFIRCHKSYIVNKSKIEFINKNKHILNLKNNIKIPFSKNMLKEEKNEHFN